MKEKSNKVVVAIVAIIMVAIAISFSAKAEEPAKPEKPAIDPARTAFLLLHWQNDLAHPKGKFAGNLPELIAAAHNIENTQAALKASRENKVFVIYVIASHRPGYPELPPDVSGIAAHAKKAQAFLRGSWGAEIIDQLKPLELEPVVFNYSPGGFAYNDLDLLLRNRGIKNLVMTGLVTNFVVESTTREAFNRCYNVCVLEDCCNSFSSEMHSWAIKNILPGFATISNSKAYIEALGVSK